MANVVKVGDKTFFVAEIAESTPINTNTSYTPSYTSYSTTRAPVCQKCEWPWLVYLVVKVGLIVGAIFAFLHIKALTNQESYSIAEFVFTYVGGVSASLVAFGMCCFSLFAICCKK